MKKRVIISIIVIVVIICLAIILINKKVEKNQSSVNDAIGKEMDSSTEVENDVGETNNLSTGENSISGKDANSTSGEDGDSASNNDINNNAYLDTDSNFVSSDGADNISSNEELNVVCDTSYINRMPGVTPGIYNDENSSGNNEYFIFHIDGMSKEEFDSKYELKQVLLNGSDIDFTEENYRNDQKAFRVDSSNMRDNNENEIKLTFLNKKTGITFTQELKAKPEIVQ